MNGQGETLKATMQPKGIELDPNKQVKNFLALKAKIIHSDELIKKFQSKAQECTSTLKELKESRRKEITLEACITGLRAELQALHHENSNFKLCVRCKEDECNSLRSRCAEQEMLIQQLTARIGELQFQREAVEEERKIVEALKEEKEKLKSLIARKKREYERVSQCLNSRMADPFEELKEMDPVLPLPESSAILPRAVPSPVESAPEELKDMKPVLQSPESSVILQRAESLPLESAPEELKDMDSILPLPESTVVLSGPVAPPVESAPVVESAPLIGTHDSVEASYVTSNDTLAASPECESSLLPDTISECDMQQESDVTDMTQKEDARVLFETQNLQEPSESGTEALLKSVVEIKPRDDDEESTLTSEITAMPLMDSNLPELIIPSDSTVTEHRVLTPPSMLCVPASTVHTTDSEESDTDICLPDFAATLSPLPFSPFHRLENVSPLPPTPPRSPISPTISPLPASPSISYGTLTPLSPLPPSPRYLTLSPLPKSPVADTRKHCCKRLDLGSGSSVGSTVSLPFEGFVITSTQQSSSDVISSSLPVPQQSEVGGADCKLEDSKVLCLGGPDSDIPEVHDVDLKVTNEIQRKRNSKRHRIPEKPSDQSPVTKVLRNSVSDEVLPFEVHSETLQTQYSDSSGASTQHVAVSVASVFDTSTTTTSCTGSTIISNSSNGTANNTDGTLGNIQSLSLPQQQLVECMQCSLPLPLWLIKSMATVQTAEPPPPSQFLSGKKAAHKNVAFNRQGKQKVIDYVKHNLERMVCGFITLSTAIRMFSNPCNVNCSAAMAKAVTQFILKSYYPKIEDVVRLFKDLQETAKDHSHPVDPLSANFPAPLLRAECQMVALFIHMFQMNAKLPQLITEITKAFYQAALSPDIRFHQLVAFCRLLTALCRFQGDAERLQFLCCDLLRKPLKPSEFHVFTAIISVWPVVLARLPGVELFEEKRIVPEGVERQSISFTLELILTAILKSQTGPIPTQMMKHFKLLCNWKQAPIHNAIDELTKVIIGLLATSIHVRIDQQIGQFPWHRPQPSVMAFHLVHCLRMLSWHQGWAWTNDILIRAHLWPTLQKWNNKSESIREATVVCIIRLIGFISGLGLAVDQQSVSIVQLQKMLISLIEKAGKSREVTLPIQLAAIDSLLEICPSGSSKAKEVKTLLFRWMDSVRGHAVWGVALIDEYQQRLTHYQ